MSKLRDVLRSCMGQHYVRGEAKFKLVEVDDDCLTLERSTDGTLFVIALSAVSFVEIKNGQLESIDYVSRRWG